MTSGFMTSDFTAMSHMNSFGSESNSSKRKAFEMLSNIFCKKSKESENSNSNSGFDDLSNRKLTHTPTYNSVASPISCLDLPDDHLPRSPISPRVKNIREDMEALTLSRQDNPYLMCQLEKLSVGGDLRAEFSMSSNSSPARSFKLPITSSIHDQNKYDNVSISMDIEVLEEESLHEKLIRSPPPNFPQKLSSFVFPDNSSEGLSIRTCSPNRFLSPTNSLFERNERVKNNEPIFNQLITNKSKENTSKCERRGSDGSIRTYYHWKNSLYDNNLTASSSALLSNNKNIKSVPHSPNLPTTSNNINFFNNYSNSNEMISNNENYTLFISPSNSSEALLKDITQVT